MNQPPATPPVPVPDADSAEFWAAAARDELLGQHCGHCGRWRWPPREHCPACHAAAVVWEQLPGTGRITGIVVVHRSFDPAYADAVPFAIVHVTLDGTDEQMILTSILGSGESCRAAVGDPVAVRFDHHGDGVALPTFILRSPAPRADP